MKEDASASAEDRPLLDHVGIAVRSLESARIYEVMGLTVDHSETVESQGVKTAFLSVGDLNLPLSSGFPVTAPCPMSSFCGRKPML